uniref:Mesothelin-like protein n=1 Tax=Erpetoichthys calabaricus TaxID=27687 RepID=A0A8C4SKT5_ERPCA
MQVEEQEKIACLLQDNREICSHFRVKRDTSSCENNNYITAAVINSSLFPITYTSSQFDACLSNQTVKENLQILVYKIYMINLQQMILDKLDEAYPYGVPEDQVLVLQPIATVASVKNINNWNITKLSTLEALLNTSYGSWTANQTAALIARYLGAGNPLDLNLLQAIGGPGICTFNINLLSNISEEILRDLGPINISTCSLDKKQLLYAKAKLAFMGERNNTKQYYSDLTNYLGGAPLEDIKGLINDNFTLDMPTLLTLDPNVLLQLSALDVKRILGDKIVTLPQYESNPIVQQWIDNQPQSALAFLNLNLTGGLVYNNPPWVFNFSIYIPVTGRGSVNLPEVLATILTALLMASWQTFM